MRASATHWTAPRLAWEGEFADDALALLARDTNWDTVAADDLVFLLPALTSSDQHGAAVAGAADHFHAALVDFEARVGRGLAPIGASVPHVRRILETLVRRATAQSSTAALQLHPAAAGSADPLPAEDQLAAEDAVLGAIYGRVHPVYAAPELVYLHEALMVAAWLGHLVAGRDAWLRPTVAEPLGMLLAAATDVKVASVTTASVAAGSETAALRTDPVATLISAHADAAGGAEPLSRMAAAVCRTRQPRLIRAIARQRVTPGG